MKKFLIVIGIAAMFLINTVATAEQVVETLTLTAADLSSANTEELKLKFQLGGSAVSISQGNSTENIVQAIVTYDSDDFKPTLRKDNSGGVFFATFSTGFEVDDIDVPDSIQIWKIIIGQYETDTDLTIDGGGITGSTDLGGMPIKDCLLNLGGAALEVDFSSPTSRQVDKFTINGGGIKLSVFNIGNTDFKEFNMAGGGNLTDLDFNGTYNSERHDANIVGAGSKISITVPTDAGEKISALTIATPMTIDGPGWEETAKSFIKKGFITDDFDMQEVQLDFDITGVGSIITIDRE